MTFVQEVRIAAIEGLRIPDGIGEGSEITVTAKVRVAKVDQEWVDVTTIAGKPEQLPGSVTLCTVATEWAAS